MSDYSDLDYAAEALYLDTGVRPGGDKETRVVGICTDIDATNRRLKVSYKGGQPVPLPALPGLYVKGQTVWLLRNPITSRTELVLGPTMGYDPQVLGVVTNVDTTNVRLTVTMPDGSSAVVPYIAASYSVSQQVWVALSPAKYGAAYLVIGPAASPPAATPQPPATSAPPAAATVSATVTIFPEYTGTYRASSPTSTKWQPPANVWNYNSTGPDALWQGNDYGSGTMVGLATYGNRITDLGAVSIEKIAVTLVGGGQSAGSYPAITLQGSPHASRPAGAPSSSGGTVSGSPGRSGRVQTDLDATMREAFRTGSFRALALVGAGYAAVRGTGSPDGMALTVTYTRTA